MKNSKPTVLVVTDKYLPSMVGGAELSLHLILKQLKPRLGRLVVAVLDGVNSPNVDNFEGVELKHLPSFGEWPPTQHETMFAKGFGPQAVTRRFAAKEMYIRFLLSGGARKFAKRWSRYQHMRTASKAQGLDYLPSLDDDLVEIRPTVRCLSDVIRDVKPDLIHADNYRSILAVANAKRLNTPFTAMVRDHRFFCAHKDQKANIRGVACQRCELKCVEIEDDFTRHSVISTMKAVRRFRRESLSKASGILTTSEFLKRQVEEVCDSRPVVAIGNPCDTIDLPSRAMKRVSKASPPEILVVGMLNFNKGQSRVVEWALALRERLKDFRIVLAGRGNLKAEIEKRAVEAGVRDFLILPGFLDRDAIYRAYARASVVVAPNVWPEPFGRVPLEAGLSQRPVVAYKTGGICESIVDGETGILIAPGAEQELLNAVVKVVENPKLAETMGRNARSFITNSYQHKQIADALFCSWMEHQSTD